MPNKRELLEHTAFWDTYKFDCLKPKCVPPSYTNTIHYGLCASYFVRKQAEKGQRYGHYFKTTQGFVY